MFLTSPALRLGSSIYWLGKWQCFFLVQSLWRLWTVGSMSVTSVVGETALEAGIWGVCRNKEGKLISVNIQILLQARGSSMLEGVGWGGGIIFYS